VQVQTNFEIGRHIVEHEQLGKGFLFEARQKRFTFDEDHFFADLVFYNRLLRCYVLIDLKIGKLTHQDLGQMQIGLWLLGSHRNLLRVVPGAQGCGTQAHRCAAV